MVISYEYWAWQFFLLGVYFLTIETVLHYTYEYEVCWYPEQKKYLGIKYIEISPAKYSDTIQK